MRILKKLSLMIVTGMTLATLSAPQAVAETKKTLLFGIVPQQAASRLAKIWVPFINALSKETGYKIKFATMKDIPTFEQCLAQGAYDIAYMNPYHYTVFSKKSGYRAFAHQSEKKLKGLIVVKKDSKAKTLDDLNNKKMAFPSPAAFGASVLPRAEMAAKGLAVDPIYVKSHDSVYRSVAAGIFAGGGGVQRTFGSMPDDLKDQLRVIYKTQAYTPHAFAVNKDVSAEKIEKISQAMAMIEKKSPELLTLIGMKGFDTASDASWDDVRNLGLSQSQTEIVQQGKVKCRLD
ncbi:MAG: phosphate/phosphite/phosphonate ABC transporter substrate-binding protein [Rhodospirillales bacterium]|nr:phosphate/phosphite/phosphonate ABC transporter substrate-binding protein [Rhodospirillales bacterium]